MLRRITIGEKQNKKLSDPSIFHLCSLTPSSRFFSSPFPIANVSPKQRRARKTLLIVRSSLRCVYIRLRVNLCNSRLFQFVNANSDIIMNLAGPFIVGNCVSILALSLRAPCDRHLFLTFFVLPRG